MKEEQFDLLLKRTIKELDKTPAYHPFCSNRRDAFDSEFPFWNHPFFEDVFVLIYDNQEPEGVRFVELTSDTLTDAKWFIMNNWNDLYSVFDTVTGSYFLRFLYDNLDILEPEEVSILLIRNWSRIKNPWNNLYIDMESVIEIFKYADRTILCGDIFLKKEYNIYRLQTRNKNPNGKSFCLSKRAAKQYREKRYTPSYTLYVNETVQIKELKVSSNDILAYFPDRKEVIIK